MMVEEHVEHGWSVDFKDLRVINEMVCAPVIKGCGDEKELIAIVPLAPVEAGKPGAQNVGNALMISLVPDFVQALLEIQKEVDANSVAYMRAWQIAEDVMLKYPGGKG